MVHVPAMYWKESDGEYPTEDNINLTEVIERNQPQNSGVQSEEWHCKLTKVAQGRREKPGKRVYMWDSFVEEKKENMVNL